MTHEAQAAEQRGYRLLRYACILYIVGFALHTADHFRRGTDTLTPEVFWLAGVANVVGVIVIALVFTGHSLAPLAAVVKGFTTEITKDDGVHRPTFNLSMFLGLCPCPSVVALL